jgi:hypothetical protein
MSSVYITIDAEPVVVSPDPPPIGQVVEEESACCCLCECCACLWYVAEATMVLFLGRFQTS